MTQKRFFSTLAAAAVCGMLMLLPGVVSAQTAHVTHFPTMDVEMSLDRTDVVLGEPVALKIKMTNTSPLPVVTLRANFKLPPGNGVEVQVQPPGELAYRYTGALEIGTYFSIPVTLQKGKPELVDVLLFFDRTQPNGLLFSKPGTYSIAGKFKFNLEKSPTPVEAILPETTIHVSEATGDNAKALEMLNRPEYIFALHVGAAATTATLNAVTRVATEYPKTHLGAMALKTEGLHYARLATAADREKGAALLTDFLRNGVVHIEGDNAAWEIAAAYHRNGEYDVARQWVIWLMRNYPQSPLIQASDPLISYYYFDPAIFTMQEPWYLVKAPWEVPGVKPPVDLNPRRDPKAPGL